MKYKHILFDLDGTLTDSKEGITKSISYALSKIGIQVSDLDTLEKFVGPPLSESFKEYYGLNEEEESDAIRYYREYFKDKGILENKVYDGIEELLIELKEKDFMLYVATSKPTVFAKIILDHFKLSNYFKGIVGSELDGTRSKKGEVIKHIINEFKLNVEDVIMVGDRKHDMIGAFENEVANLGVTYGYGTKEELQKSGANYIAEEIRDISRILMK